MNFKALVKVKRQSLLRILRIRLRLLKNAMAITLLRRLF